MKVLAIRGRNLASLEGEFEIDFTEEPLVSVGLFAISGPTGAGKSTLLDAMCLALFSRTPRTEQAKENNVRLKDVNDDALPQGDPRFLLRRGTTSGYAEVDFEAQNGQWYRARWSVSRARDKENGRLQTPRTTLFNLGKNEEEQGTRSDLQARIIELVGLSFEQFTRSVLLAQNDFSTFLKAEQGEKAALLEKLTGTEHYSNISRLIFVRNAEAREAYEKVASKMQGIELLSEEEETSLRNRVVEVEAVLARLEAAKAERQQLQEAVRTAERQLWDRQIRQKEASEQLIHSGFLLEKACKEYESGQEKLTYSETLYKQLMPQLQQARKLDVQIETAAGLLAKSELQWKEAGQSKKEAEDKLAGLLDMERKGLEEIDKLKAWREKYRSKEGIAVQLTALLLHLDAAFSARRMVEKTKLSVEESKGGVARLEEELAKLSATISQKAAVRQKQEEEYSRLESLLKETNLEEVESEMAVCRSGRERLLVEQARFVATGDVKALRDNLSEGIPCPVCGSLQHPYASHEANEKLLALAKDISAVTLQLQQLTKLVDAHSANRKKLADLQQQQLLLHRQMTEDENVRTDLLNRQQLMATQIRNDETLVVEQKETLKRSLSAANYLFGNDAWQQSWQQSPESFRKTLTDFACQWHDNEESLFQLERQQGEWKAACESHRSFLPKLEAQWHEFGIMYRGHLSDLKKYRDERARLLEGRLADEVEEEQTRHMETLKEELQKLQALQVEQSGKVEQYKGITEQIARDLSEITIVLQQQTKELNEWITRYNEKSEGISLEESFEEQVKERTECLFRLRTHTENRQKLTGLKEELDKRAVVSDRWAKLNDLAGSADGAKFRRIAQGYTLDILLNYANVQLRLLTRRYRLERVPETLALQVIDQDMCDEVRSVHSLSGGESFLVSLALALGLSSLSSNRMKVESLFIDEGFGSLDAETLRVAMDALESLHTQGRKIGVISHVQEMTERIPAQIQVNRAGNGRSIIRITAPL